MVESSKIKSLNYMNSIQITIYNYAQLFWGMLPPELKKIVLKTRQFFLRLIRAFRVLKSFILRPKDDLTWKQFKALTIDQRQYRGIFIQELIIDWNTPLFQRPQHLSNALAKLGYLVIYKTRNWGKDNVLGFKQVNNNVWISSAKEVDSIEGAIRSFYSTYPTPIEYLKKLKQKSKIIYEYVDHIDPKISGGSNNIKALLELKSFCFSGGADLIVPSAAVLQNEVSEKSQVNSVLVPNGVDTSHYFNSPKNIENITTITNFKKKYKTIVGYFGAIAPWLWFNLINDLTKLRSDIGFIFIGPDYSGALKKLTQRENILYTGPIDYLDLPRHASCFNIAFIPFEPGDIAQTTSPLKLFEYFALEKPVVVTHDMIECIKFDAVFSAHDLKSFSDAIDAAIVASSDPTVASALKKQAIENDWFHRAKTLDYKLQELV